MGATSTGQGQAGDGGGEGQQGGEATDSGPDFSAMMEAIQSQGSELGQMRDFLQSAPWQQLEGADGQQETGEPALPEIDLGFLDDPEAAAGMDPQQFAQQLQQTITQAAEQIADQRVAPIQEGLDEMRRTQEVNALVGEFPELGEAEVGQQVVTAAEQLAKEMNRPELAQEPSFWRLVYMAGRAADAAQEEQGDIPAPTSLESGAGATPGGGGGDLGDAIVGARAGRGVLPFG